MFTLAASLFSIQWLPGVTEVGPGGNHKIGFAHHFSMVAIE
jgi:hypothetical protein